MSDCEQASGRGTGQGCDKSACGCRSRGGVSRIGFIAWMFAGWAIFWAAMGGFMTMILRFLAPNVNYEPSQSFLAGRSDDYASGEVSMRYQAKHGVWIVRLDDRIVALSTTCTHLGCTPNWLAAESKFKCPCHGSGFRKTGDNFEGPAPRPLERFKIVLMDDGQLLVDRGIAFRAERGEWENPESYVAV